MIQFHDGKHGSSPRYSGQDKISYGLREKRLDGTLPFRAIFPPNRSLAPLWKVAVKRCRNLKPGDVSPAEMAFHYNRTEPLLDLRRLDARGACSHRESFSILQKSVSDTHGRKRRPKLTALMYPLEITVIDRTAIGSRTNPTRTKIVREFPSPRPCVQQSHARRETIRILPRGNCLWTTAGEICSNPAVPEFFGAVYRSEGRRADPFGPRRNGSCAAMGKPDGRARAR